MAKDNSNQAALLDALRHPLRRSLLRRLVESGERLSPRELARLEGRPLSSVAYHVSKLAELGAIERAGEVQIGFSGMHLYRATARVSEMPEVLAALGLED